MGSYLCQIQHPDHPELPPVRYPVSLGRGEHWHGVAPGESSPRPVFLPGPGVLGPLDCYVPAGWFIAGGDPKAGDSLPRTSLWCEAMVFERFQVTNRRYIAFLDDLVAQGREADALRWAPRERTGARDGRGALNYSRDEQGRFILAPDNDGDMWDPDWPVLNVHWGCALAYARWRAERDGKPWRLAGEIEWEKAARGVDARWYPWGDFLDPSWACVRDSHRDRRLPSRVHDYPVDVSVYGIRGLGGNAYEWCAELMNQEARQLDSPLLQPPLIDGTPAVEVGLRRAVKGGHWFGMPKVCKSALRWAAASTARDSSLSIRVCRSLCP